MSNYLEPKNRSERRMKKSKRFQKVIAAHQNKASNPFLMHECISSEFLMQEGKVGEVGRSYRKPRKR